MIYNYFRYIYKKDHLYQTYLQKNGRIGLTESDLYKSYRQAFDDVSTDFNFITSK